MAQRFIAREHEVESAVRYFKQWVAYANETLPSVLENEALKRDAEERERIRKATVAEEARLNALRKAREALG